MGWKGTKHVTGTWLHAGDIQFFKIIAEDGALVSFSDIVYIKGGLRHTI